jgi:hypothetical protein
VGASLIAAFSCASAEGISATFNEERFAPSRVKLQGELVYRQNAICRQTCNDNQ